MNYEPPHSPQDYAARGRGWKWLSGGAVAAMLWSGVFYAWVTLQPAQPGQFAAFNAPFFAQTLGAPVRTELASLDHAVTAQGSAAPDETRTAAAMRPHPIHARRAAAPAPEEMARVIDVSATSQDSAAIVVQGARASVWVRTPSAWSLANAYPRRALESGREGEASVHCSVRNSGALNCVRRSETPGFGEAALRVARLFRHTPRRADGIDSTVDLRIVFRMPDNDRRG